MSWLNGLGTAVSTIAAVVSVVAAIRTNDSERRLKEALETATSVSDWAKSLTESGGHCATMLSQYSAQEFADFVNRASNKLRDDQRQFLPRCTVAYDKPGFDPKGALVLTEQERSYLTHQVVGNLNSYETLSSKWAALGSDSKKKICEQAGLSANSPYRTFRKVAEGTTWWKYPNFTQFMDDCKP